MALIKITFDSASVSSKMDADVNHYLTSSQNGIFYDLGGRCAASVSNSYIIFQSGYAQVYGRRVLVETGTKIAISLDSTANGYVVIKIDLGNNEVSLNKKEVSSGYPLLTQEDLRNGGLIYELPLCRYSKTPSSITIDSTYDVPYILGNFTMAYQLIERKIQEVHAAYGPSFQQTYTSKSGNAYKFTLINAHNASDGVIGCYVGGCYVTFKSNAVMGSGGLVYYRYMGNDYQLDAHLTADYLIIEDSRGSEIKYVAVSR